MRRDLLILIGLFALLAAFVTLGPGRDEAEGPRGTSHSSSQSGALALFRWLNDMGYRAERLEYEEFDPAAAGELLFVLAPSEAISREEAEAVLRWVEAGGTLVLAADRPGGAGAAALLRALGVRVEPAPDGFVGAAAVRQPALGDPALASIQADTAAVLAAAGDDLALLVGADEAPVLVGRQLGEGYAYVSSTLAPFSNSGLRDPDHAALILNMLRRVGPGGQVAFDEIHHGFTGSADPTLRSLLLGGPWGWAFLYAAAVGAAYVAATGRRFGRPVPLREETARRSSAEYLESMAGLLRRGGKRSYVARHYHAALKRRLARPLGLSPALDDEAFAAEVAASRPVDAAALRELLARLRRPDLSEAELVRLVDEGDRIGR